MLLSDLPKPVFLKELPEYEHLSFLWAQGVDKAVFPDVVELLNRFRVFPPRQESPGDHTESDKLIPLNDRLDSPADN